MTTLCGCLFQGRKWNMGDEYYGKQWQTGDVVGCMLDLHDKTISKPDILVYSQGVKMKCF